MRSRAIGSEVKDAIVGVGTITRAEEFAARWRRARVSASAPGLTPELAAAARASAAAAAAGRDDAVRRDGRAAPPASRELKLFPALQAGGVGHAEGARRAVSGRRSSARPAGITAETAPEFLALPNVACVGGSWLTPKDAVERGDWETLTRLARQASQLSQPN